MPRALSFRTFCRRATVFRSNREMSVSTPMQDQVSSCRSHNKIREENLTWERDFPDFLESQYGKGAAGFEQQKKTRHLSSDKYRGLLLN